MKKVYKVFSVEPQQVEVVANVGGKPTKVLAPTVVAQLVPVHDDGSGTLKTAVDAENLKMFELGDEVTVTFSSE